VYKKWLLQKKATHIDFYWEIIESNFVRSIQFCHAALWKEYIQRVPLEPLFCSIPIYFDWNHNFKCFLRKWTFFNFHKKMGKSILRNENQSSFFLFYVVQCLLAQGHIKYFSETFSGLLIHRLMLCFTCSIWWNWIWATIWLSNLQNPHLIMSEMLR